MEKEKSSPYTFFILRYRLVNLQGGIFAFEKEEKLWQTKEQKNKKYKTYLSTMSKFHNYSFNNTLLIAMQKPEATLVAGYKAWQKNFERHVNKEKAICILAPVPICFEDIPGDSKGYFHTEEKRIAVQENMSESQTLKTMVHEVAHSMLHNKEINRNSWIFDTVCLAVIQKSGGSRKRQIQETKPYHKGRCHIHLYLPVYYVYVNHDVTVQVQMSGKKLICKKMFGIIMPNG